MKKVFLAVLAMVLSLPSIACTSFLVGKKASTDGSVFISYNADDYGMYGHLIYLPHAIHPQGTVRKIIDGDTNHYLGEIPEARETYKVNGYINEFQVSIMESTWGGREELVDSKGIIDYVSLMRIALQRSKTAREAINVMTTLVEKYGYTSSGESFSIADKNEIWIMEMIGKGDAQKGAVWVAVRIPDDCIAAHANQSRIHKFDLKDKQNVMYAKDVIKFAREKGYFTGKDADFSFSAAYSPADFGSQRFCDARAWSFFNHFVEGMDKYVPYVDGYHIGQSEEMPLYFKPKHLLSLEDVMEAMRDHYEGTPFEFHSTLAGGVYGAPYQPSPLMWEHKGKKYFNERPISTQQASYVVIAQLRSWLPREVGGVLWFGNDDPNMIAFTPVYCSATEVPECYADCTGNDHKFTWKSAFWMQNWVSNMVYPRYKQMFPTLKKWRDQVQEFYIKTLRTSDEVGMERLKANPADGVAYLTDQTKFYAGHMMHVWHQLGEYLIIKYNDQVIKVETEDEEWKLTPDSICVPTERPGYPEEYREKLIKETGDRFLMPAKK